MTKVIINIENQEISVFNTNKQSWETCTLHEAGMDDMDKDEMIDKLLEDEDIADVSEVKFSSLHENFGGITVQM
jgi:hypothetical protein